MNINPKSYHLTTFELMNQLPYINFSSFECRFLKRSEVYVVVVGCVVTSVTSLLEKLQNENEDKTETHD